MKTIFLLSVIIGAAFTSELATNEIFTQINKVYFILTLV
jgi:hypothetical protein